MKKKQLLLIALLLMATIVMRAQQVLPPQWLRPATNEQALRGDTISLNPLIAQFSWTPVTLQLPDAPTARMTYNIRIIRLSPDIQADYAIRTAPVLYKRNGLMTTTFTIPAKVVKAELREGETYLVQVQAVGSSLPIGMRTEDIVQNGGCSPLLFFRIKGSEQ